MIKLYMEGVLKSLLVSFNIIFIVVCLLILVPFLIGAALVGMEQTTELQSIVKRGKK